jgi:hypothetical protein
VTCLSRRGSFLQRFEASEEGSKLCFERGVLRSHPITLLLVGEVPAQAAEARRLRHCIPPNNSRKVDSATILSSGMGAAMVGVPE